MITVILMMLLNRVRGGGLWLGTYLKETLHVKPLYLVSPVVTGVALLAGAPLITSITLAAAYLIWAVPAWGRWFDLNNLPDDYNRVEGKYADPLEKWIDGLPGDDVKKMFVRHGVMLSLAMLLVSVVAGSPLPMVMVAPMTTFIVYSYAIGWVFAPAYPILVAELLTGAVWGTMIWLISLINN